MVRLATPQERPSQRFIRCVRFNETGSGYAERAARGRARVDAARHSVRECDRRRARLRLPGGRIPPGLVQPKDAAGAFFSSDTFGHFAPMVLTTADNNRTGVAALASRMTKPAVIVAPRSNTTRLEDFEIQRKLGKGSFGVVYAVTRRRDPTEKKKTYVMKQISMGPSRADQEDAINECRVLAKLNHAHVVRYHESFVASGNRLCIVMEYAPKGTVHSLVQGAKPKTLPEDVVWKLTLQSALGLHHIHSLKILHRDIKAENIFLDKDGNAKIGDLGVAKVMTRTVDFAKTLVGTPYYLSPELCENKPYNHKSDVWSLGCVVYEMMTGSHPFNAQNQGALFIKILKGKYAPVRTPAYSHDLKELMDRCLTVNQTRRPDTVSILQSRAAHAKARTLGLELPGDVPAPVPGLGSENNEPDLEVAKRAAAQQRRAATAVGSSRVRDVKPPQHMETRQQIIDRVKSARVDGTDRLPPRTDGFRVAGYGGAGGLAYAAARMADQSNARRPSTALPGGGTVAARSAAVIAGIAAAAAGGGVKGTAAAESELRRIRADSARLAAKAEGAAQNRAAAADAARGAEDEAARRRKEAGDAMRAARERRRQAEEEERIKAKAAAERQRERVATAAAAAEESRAKLMAAKAKLAEKRAGGRAVQSARGIGGYDASRYENERTPPQKTVLPPSPLQGLAVATGALGTAHRRAPSSRKPVAANPGTVAVARPVSAVGVGVQSRPQSAAERREAARVVDADLVAALPESPGGVGTSSRHVAPVDVVTVDVPEFDEARAMAEIAARHVPPRVPVRNTNPLRLGVNDGTVSGSELSVSNPATPSRSRPRTAAGRGVVDVAKARRDAATASRAAIRLAKSPNPSSSRPASAFVRRTEDIFAGGPRGGGTKVVTEGDSPPLASDSRLVPVVSSYAEAHEQKMKATEDQFEGTAASAIGVARAAAAAVNQFVAATTCSDSFGADDGAGMESSGTFSAEELGRVAAETAAAARAAASIASGSSRSDRSSSFDRQESSPRVDVNAAQIPKYHPITDETRTRDGIDGETNGGVPAFVFGNAPGGTDTFDEGTRTSPGSVDRGAVARALRATVKALESALGPPDEETDTDFGDEAIDSQLKPFYDDDGGSESESEPASTPSTPRSAEYYSGSDSEERFVRVHGASRGERVEELVSEMTVTEEAAVAIVGAESFGLLYDFLAKKSEAADDGRLNRPGTPGKVRALSERVFDIIPRDKTEAVTLAYRYMHLVEKLQDLE